MQTENWMMEYAVKILEAERNAVVAAMKAGHNERLKDLQELDKALGWLRLLQEQQVDKAGRYNLDALPYIEDRGGFTYYRLMVDNETDNTADWDEYKKPDGSRYELHSGDFILEAKI